MGLELSENWNWKKGILKMHQMFNWEILIINSMCGAPKENLEGSLDFWFREGGAELPVRYILSIIEVLYLRWKKMSWLKLVNYEVPMGSSDGFIQKIPEKLYGDILFPTQKYMGK